MPEVVMKMLADQLLAKEPKDSSDFVDLNDGTGPLQIFAGDKVKTGAKDSVQETVDGREITWVFVEAIDGDNADKKKGFVSDKFLVAEGTAVPMSAGFQPFSPAVDKAAFAQACYLQAALNKTNPAYLYALAFALSGDKWSSTQVQTGDPAGVFRFSKETWQSLISEPEAVGFQADQIRFPNAQCVVAAIIAAKSASLLQGLITDRGLSAVDLLLAHLFADNKSFGSNAAARILQAEKDNKGQKSEAVIKAEIYPDNANAAAFFQRNADVFKVDGSATIEEALKACTDKLAAGFAAVANLAKDLDAEQDPNLQDCQVALFGDDVPKNPRDPILGLGAGTIGATGAGGGVIESQQHATRNKSISSELHDILEYAGRKTGIDVEVYSGGQPPTGPDRTGTHRHDVGPGLMGAADLHMRDARTGRILDSDNRDDRKRMANFMAEAANAGATGIGHARDYMGTKSTHIGGGSEAVWGAGAVRAGAPQWVVDAFQSGRAHPLTSAQFASALSTLRATPIQSANTDTDNIKALAGARQRFVNELKDFEIHRLIAASTNAEVGGQGPKAEQYYIESVFNRATARNKTLRQTVSDSAYYPPTTLNRLNNSVQPSKQTRIDQIIASVMAGANESNFATGNESGSVDSDGAPFAASARQKLRVRQPDAWFRQPYRIQKDALAPLPPDADRTRHVERFHAIFGSEAVTFPWLDTLKVTGLSTRRSADHKAVNILSSAQATQGSDLHRLQVHFRLATEDPVGHVMTITDNADRRFCSVLPADKEKRIFQLEIDIEREGGQGAYIRVATYLSPLNKGPTQQIASAWDQMRARDPVAASQQLEDSGAAVELENAFQMGEEVLANKLRAPLAAAVATVLLLKGNRFDLMHDWARNVGNWFPWIPDGVVLWSEQCRRMAAGRPLDPDLFPWVVRGLSRRSLPFTAEGLGLAADIVTDITRGRFKTDDATRDATKALGARIDRVLPYFRNTGLFCTFAGWPDDWDPAAILGPPIA